MAEESGAARVVACIDARMREVYYAALEKRAGRWHEVVPAQCVAPHAAPLPPGDGWIGVRQRFCGLREELTGKVSVVRSADPSNRGCGGASSPRRASRRARASTPRWRRRSTCATRSRSPRRSSAGDERRPQGCAATLVARMREQELDEVMAIESAIYSHPWTRGNFRRLAARRLPVLRAGSVGRGAGRLLRADGGGGRRRICSTCRSPLRASARATAALLLREAARPCRAASARAACFSKCGRATAGAQALYTRFGFRKVAVRRGYYPARARARGRAGPDLAARMTRRAADAGRDGPRARLEVANRNEAPCRRSRTSARAMAGSR